MNLEELLKSFLKSYTSFLRDWKITTIIDK